VPSRKHRATPSLAKASRVEKQLKSEVSDLDHFLAKVSSLGTETGLVEPVEPVAPVDPLLPKSHGTASMEVEQQVFTKAAAGTDLDSSASHNAVTAPAHDAPELDSIDWEDSESGGIAKRNFVESSIEQAIKIRKLEQLIGRLEDSSRQKDVLIAAQKEKVDKVMPMMAQMENRIALMEKEKPSPRT